jgi:fibronectin-binding autotransporter adhesin
MPPARFTAHCSRTSRRTLAAFFVSAFPLLATAQTWTNPATGDWFTGDNWDSGLVPLANGSVTIDAGTAAIFGENASAFSVILGQTVSGSTAALTINEAGSLTSDSARLGYTAGTNGTATLAGTGSQWTIGSSLTVGRDGNGIVQVTEGAALSTGTTTVIGANAGSDSNLSVSEEGSHWNATGSVYVGDHGTGRLRIYQGATASFTSSTSVGRETGGTGIVTLEDAGTTWNTQGLVLGYRGAATVYITDEALLANTGGAQLGAVAGAIGTVDLNRGGRWTNAGDLTVGLFGEGVIYLNGGSELTAAASILGADTVASGSVTLEGASSWTNSAELVVGMSGDGHLSIYEGSTVSNTEGVIGYYGSSLGHVEVAGENSHWTNTESLYVGLAGNALLMIYDQGRVSVGGDSVVRLGHLGEIQIGGGETAGTLDAATVTANSGGKITFDHAETAYEFSPDITGTVSIVQLGTGRTILTGANTFSGFTTISDGTLAAGAANVLSANSAIFINNGATLDLAGHDQTVGDLDSYNFGTGQNDSGIVILGGATLTNRNRVTNNWAGSLTGTGTLVKQGGEAMNWYGANTFTGLLPIEAGTLNASAENTLSANAVVHVAAPAILALQNNQTIAGLSGSGLVNLGGSTLTIAQSADTLFSGTLGGQGNTVKTGAGTLTLAGTNVISGNMSVEAGALVVNGSLSALVTVEAGASLGGTGIISRFTELVSGAHIGVAGTADTLVFSGGLALSATASFNLELGAISDTISVTGVALFGPYDGKIIVNLFDSGGFTAGTYTLIDATGAELDSIGATTFELGTTIDGYDYVITQEDNRFLLTATAVPEPASAAALAGLFTLALAATRRRRRGRA